MQINYFPTTETAYFDGRPTMANKFATTLRAWLLRPSARNARTALDKHQLKARAKLHLNYTEFVPWLTAPTAHIPITAYPSPDSAPVAEVTSDDELEYTSPHLHSTPILTHSPPLHPTENPYSPGTSYPIHILNPPPLHQFGKRYSSDSPPPAPPRVTRPHTLPQPHQPCPLSSSG